MSAFSLEHGKWLIFSFLTRGQTGKLPSNWPAKKPQRTVVQKGETGRVWTALRWQDSGAISEHNCFTLCSGIAKPKLCDADMGTGCTPSTASFDP